MKFRDDAERNEALSVATCVQDLLLHLKDSGIRPEVITIGFLTAVVSMLRRETVLEAYELAKDELEDWQYAMKGTH
jgi:hypothetical protein